MSLGWNQATSGLFISKFVLGETRFILIDEQTPAITSNQVQQFGELVKSVKYNLITETLESDSLQSLLGQS
jgi:ABC-type sugar transport system ATPase subunit